MKNMLKCVAILILPLCPLQLIAQDENSFALKNGAGKTPADLAWDSYPVFQDHIARTWSPVDDQDVSTDEMKRHMRQSYIFHERTRETYSKELRDWGLYFWKSYPQDPRRFNWLENTIQSFPTYYMNLEEGILDKLARKYEAALDTTTLSEWRRIYPTLRSEYLSQPNLTEKQKNEFILSELMGDLYMEMYPVVNGGRKLNIETYKKKIIDIIPYWLTNSTYAYPKNEIINVLQQIQSNRESYRLEVADMISLYKSFLNSPYYTLSNNAAQNLRLLQMYNEPFEFRSRDITGKGFDLSKMKNKLVFLDLWSISCKTCIAKMPEIKAVYEKYKSHGFEVLSICLDPEKNKDQAMKIHEKVGAHWPLFIVGGKDWNDSSSLANKILEKYGFRSVPQLFLLGKDRKVIAYNGNMLRQKGEVEKLVQKYLFNTAERINTGSKVVIKGKIKNLKDSTAIALTVSDKQTNKSDTIDLTYSRNGEFQLAGRLPTDGMFCYLWVGENAIAERKYLTLFANNGDKITISGTEDSWPKATVHGGPSEHLYSYINLEQPFRDSLKLVTDKNKTESLANALMDVRKRFITNHLNSTYTAFLILTTKQWNYHEKSDLYNRLGNKVKESSYGIRLKEDIDARKKSTEVKIGNRIPELTLSDTSLKKVNINQLLGKGKVYLIDFWASWCKPCREENPYMQQLLKSYSSKGLSIIGISLDKNADQWKRAIIADGLNWHHLSDLKGWESAASTIFDLQSIPRKLLIDRNGIILSINPDKEKLEELIRKLLI